jgi:hypothetical protein
MLDISPWKLVGANRVGPPMFPLTLRTHVVGFKCNAALMFGGRKSFLSNEWTAHSDSGLVRRPKFLFAVRYCDACRTISHTVMFQK